MDFLDPFIDRVSELHKYVEITLRRILNNFT